jgi:Apea-like HEPN
MRRDGEKVLHRKHETFPDYSTLLSSGSVNIYERSSFKALFASIDGDMELVRLFGLTAYSDDIRKTHFLDNYFIPMAAVYLQREQATKDKEQVESSVITQLNDFLVKGTYTSRVYAPLINFDSDVEDLELADGVFLRSVSDATLESHINILSRSRGDLGLRPLLESGFQLEGATEQERGDNQEPTYNSTTLINAQIRKLEDFLKVFRLLKPGAIGYSFTAGVAGIFPFSSGTDVVHPASEQLYGNVYKFAGDDIQQIKNGLAALNCLEKQPRFSLALRRLMEAYRKPMGGDRLVDYWIGLESVLLPQEKEGELRFRAALRGAWSLGDDAEARRKTFGGLRKSYNARSAVVHGTGKTADETIVLMTEEYLRNILKWCLAKGEGPSVDMLNSLVVGGVPIEE